MASPPWKTSRERHSKPYLTSLMQPTPTSGENAAKLAPSTSRLSSTYGPIRRGIHGTNKEDPPGPTKTDTLPIRQQQPTQPLRRKNPSSGFVLMIWIKNRMPIDVNVVSIHSYTLQAGHAVALASYRTELKTYCPQAGI